MTRRMLVAAVMVLSGFCTAGVVRADGPPAEATCFPLPPDAGDSTPALHFESLLSFNGWDSILQPFRLEGIFGSQLWRYEALFDSVNPPKMQAVAARHASTGMGTDGDKAASQSTSERELAMAKQLSTPVSFNLRETPLRQAIEALRICHSANLLVDQAALDEEGISFELPVTMRLENVALKSALNLMLQQAHLTFVIKDDTCWITTAKRAQGLPVQRVYQVADLVIPIEGVVRSSGEQGKLEDELIRQIKNTVAPKSWNDQGGAGTIDYHPMTMSFAINQPSDIQEQIADLLTALRRLRDQQVALEVRFIAISDSLWERLGQNFLRQVAKIPDCCRSSAVIYLDSEQERRLLEGCQVDQDAEVMQAPKVTLYSGQGTDIRITDKNHFVTGVDVRWDRERVLAVPKNEELITGLELTAKPVIAPDRRSVALALKGEYTCLESDRMALSPVTTMIKGRDRTGDAIEPISFTQYIQMPRVQTLSLDNVLQIPDGSAALVYLGKRSCEKRSEYRTPLLGELPYVGDWFTSIGYTTKCQHVLMIVMPKIIIPAVEELGSTGLEVGRFLPTAAANMNKASDFEIELGCGIAPACFNDMVQAVAKEVLPSPMPILESGGFRSEVAASFPNPIRVIYDATIPDGGTVVIGGQRFVSPASSIEVKAQIEPLAPVRSASDPFAEAERWKDQMVAGLVAKYREACSEGRFDEARTFATRAMVLDPACFIKDR